MKLFADLCGHPLTDRRPLRWMNLGSCSHLILLQKPQVCLETQRDQ